MLLFWKKIDKAQMSKPPECAATFLNFFRSIYVSHLGLQSVTYRVDTPCSQCLKYYVQSTLHTLMKRHLLV